MKLIEIRDLDGPNMFLLRPTIKVEVVDDVDHIQAVDLSQRFGLASMVTNAEARRQTGFDVIAHAIQRLHERSGAEAPETIIAKLETPGHVAIAFSWNHRRFALTVAEFVANVIAGETIDLDTAAADLRHVLGSLKPDDRPLLIRDEDRSVKAIAVTGTNGKTTTTRLIAHILRTTGKHVGWCSSSGVYIDGKQVVDGDYSGPSGARRVLTEPGVDVGVLETARGGILLRGTAYQSNDISVFINISADHLDLQGIRTVEGLAKVKSVVVRVTKSEGVAVLNADDPLVMAASTSSETPIRATPWLVSQHSSNEYLLPHLDAGGTALVVEDESIVFKTGETQRRLIDLGRVPITYDGKAKHMVENALCAAAATLAFGLTEDEVVHGLASFENSPELNQGRLNVVHADGVTIVVDYAHNESGLSHLLEFTRLHVQPGHRLISIIGTAGDRTDQSLRAIGRVAAEGSDLVFLKGTERYLRGRPLEELLALYSEGIAQVGKSAFSTEPDELLAVESAVAEAEPGDAICVMAQEHISEILEFLVAKQELTRQSQTVSDPVTA